MSPRNERSCNKKVNFKVLDSRKNPNGIEYDIEVNKEKERGLAVLKIFGPNKTNVATVMINKAKKMISSLLKFLQLMSLSNSWTDLMVVTDG